jgi:hypothetical protein
MTDPILQTAPLVPRVDITGVRAAEIKRLPFQIVGLTTNTLYAAAANPISAMPIMPEGFITYTDILPSDDPGS